MIVTYREHQLRGEGKYKCPQCKYSFKRVETSSWTENPFNKAWQENPIEGAKQCNNECRDTIKKYLATKKCPKCNTICNNLNNK